MIINFIPMLIWIIFLNMNFKHLWQSEVFRPFTSHHMKFVCRINKSNNFSLDHNNLFKNPILFCKFLSPLKLYRNGFVFKIHIWISSFSTKKRDENLMLGCRDMCKINTAPFFETPCISYQCWSEYFFALGFDYKTIIK